MSQDFETLFSVDDLERQAHPMRTAQASMRKPLPKRFYALASAEGFEGGFRLVLDGKPALTPKRAFLATHSLVSAELIAAEWNAQGEIIDPGTMHATRIVNAALDHVAFAMDEVRADAARYIGSDLVCYRSSQPERLVELQRQHWDPLVVYCAERFGIMPRLADSIMHVPQDEALLEACRAALGATSNPIALAALHVMVTLSGSAIIALACAEKHLSPAQAFAASELDADFETEVWGSDEEAARRRLAREAEFLAAAALYHAAAD
jgi:chaperone required for assembly of F1-ATPase